VFYRDTRLMSRWELLVDGDPVEPMAVVPGQPFFATFVGRSHPRPGRAESTVLVTRTRYVGDGMREDIAVQNFAEESIGVHISLRAESDLAGIFDVEPEHPRSRQESLRQRAGRHDRVDRIGGGLRPHHRGGGDDTGLRAGLEDGHRLG
jgi:hypothetical protein